MAKRKRRYTRRVQDSVQTVQAPLTLADVTAAVAAALAAQTPKAAQVAAVSPLANGSMTGRTGPRKAYSVVKTPIPPFGETTMAVWNWLKANSPATQADLESGTGLTEGQIKGAIRQLALAGYVSVTKADRT